MRLTSRGRLVLVLLWLVLVLALNAHYLSNVPSELS